MADIESNIGINIDTSNALAAIKNLQRQISAFHSSMSAGNAKMQADAAGLQKDLINNINATGKFSASLTRIKTTADSFTTALEKNKLTMREYFRYSAAASKNFSKGFGKELSTIDKVARERVKELQSQYIKLGRDASGAVTAMKVRPLVLDMNDLGTKTQIAAQKQQIFNQLLKQGSTNLLNFGKNTQWAGRQLMVGFTIPLSIFGTQASKIFMDLEKQAIKFRRVYGDLFTSPEETDKVIDDLRKLAVEFTKYGVAVSETMEQAASAAAMGKTGVDLIAQVSEATRLSVLGNVAQAEALDTTISLTNAFGIAAEDLASKIDFLNAVENQTVTAIEDLTIAIPKAAPVIQQLGGNVEDLAFFLTAMKEGGINASQGANALKSGLASLINPTGKASDMLAGFGINIQKIVEANKGDVKGLVIDFASALDELEPLKRAQAIEQLFGKFQFARVSTLFQNVIKEGTQAQRVLELTNATTADLARLSQKELGSVAESTTFRFEAAVERLKVAIAPIGEQFLKAITPVIEFAADLINKFNAMGDGIKNFAVIGTTILAGLGPVFLMLFGLVANGVANIIKGFAAVRSLFMKTRESTTTLGEQFDYMTKEQIEATSVAASLERAHMQLQQRFTSEASAVQKLIGAYERATAAQTRFRGGAAQGDSEGMRLASGIVSVPGPKGAGDIVPAMLSPGEAVIPADAARKYAPLIQGMISDNIPGFSKGVMLGMPRSGKGVQKDRDAAEQIYQQFLKSSYANVPPTNYGHQLSPTSGRSFPIWGLGGVYMGPDGQKVFVKPVMDEKAALAEMRGTQIARQAHGLKAPEQRIVVMRDPKDVTGTRRFLALESKLDSTFVNTDPMAVFNEDQYFKQLVASLVRVDKDLAAGNMFGDVVADVGPAGVFNRASGVRDYTTDLPSMEQQAMVNLLGIKGGAKRAFAESTLGLMAGLTPEQYHQKMISEIQQVLPMLKQTIAGFKLTDPTEVEVYNAMVKRLEQGLSVDWSNFHAIHSAVKPVKPRQTAKPIPGYADGVVSVPGPKGAGDVVPAMLSPGEAVIPAKKAKKYAPLINAMIAGNIPGYKLGKPAEIAKEKYSREIAAFPDLAEAIDSAVAKIEESGKGLSDSEVFDQLEKELKDLLKAIKTTNEYNKELGVKASSVTGAVAAHGNRRKELSVEESNRIGAEMKAKGFTGKVAQGLASTTKPVQAYSNLTFPMPASFNTESMAGSDAAAWIREDFQRFMSMILKNTGLDPNDPEARQFAEGVANELELAGSRAISESNFENTVANQIGMLAEGAARRALEEARDTYQTFNVELPGSKRARREKAQVGTGINEANQVLTGSTQKTYKASALAKLVREANADADQFVVKVSQAFIYALKKGLLVNSPSREFEKVSDAVSDGVRQSTDDAQKAGEDIGNTVVRSASTGAKQASGSSFVKPITSSPSQSQYVPKPLPLPSQAQSVAVAKEAAGMSMSPMKAYFTVVGANLREAVQDFKSEVGIVSKDSMGPLEAYLTTVRANLRDVWTDSKAEFKSIFSGPAVADAGLSAAQKFRQGLEQAHPQLIIDGVEAGRDYAAALNGQHGGIAAVLTKKNAELVSRLNTEYQNGTSKITAGIRQSPLFALAGGEVSRQIANSIINTSRQLAPGVGQAVSQGINPALFNQPLGNIVSTDVGGESSGVKTFGDRLSGVNSGMMAFSGTISSLGMMAAMAGDSLGGMGEQIYQMSNLFFMLTGIIQLLNTEQIKNLTILKAQNMGEFFSNIKTSGLNSFKSLKNSAKVTSKVFSGGLKGSISNIGKLFGGLGSKIMNLGGGLGRLIPVVGSAIAAFQVIKFISDVQKEQESKIRGMGDAAFLAGEKLSAIAALLPDYEPERDPGTVGSAVVDRESGMSAAAQAAEKGVDGDALKTLIEEGGELEDMANAIKSATGEELKTLLTSLANEMIALDPDIDPSSVQGLLSRIAKEVGQSGVSFGDMLIPDPNDPKFKAKLDSTIGQISADAEDLSRQVSAVRDEAFRTMPAEATSQDYENANKQILKAFAGDASVIASRAASAIETLKTSLRLGLVDTEEFGASMDAAISGIASLGGELGGEAADSLMLKLGFNEETISELETIEAKLNAIKFASTANITGDQIDLSLLKAVDAGNKVGASAKEISNARRALVQLEKQYDNTADAAFRSGDEQLQQAEDAKRYFDDQIGANKEILSSANSIIETNDKIGGSIISISDAIDMLKDEKFAAAFEEAKDDPEKLEEVIAQYNEYRESVEKLNDAVALSNIDSAIADLKENEEVQGKLEDVGYTAAESQTILADSMWRAAFAAASTAEEIEALKIKYAEYTALVESQKGPSGPGGSRQQTPFEKAEEQLKSQRKEILNNKKAYAGLREEGFSVSQAFEAAADSTLAAALASEKVGSAKWEKLVKLAKDYNKELLKMDIAELTRRNNIEIETINNTFKIQEGLEKAGYSAETIERAIEQIGDNPDILARLAKDLKDGEVNAKNMVDLLKSIDGITIAVELTQTPEQLRDKAMEAVGVLNNWFSTQESAIRSAFATGTELALDLDNDSKTVDVKINPGKINITELEKDIAEAEEYIAKRQFQIDDFQYGLDQIAEQEEEINKKYDERIEALDKVSSLNQKIAEGQRSQLDVATALASGDIAAAARAMQEDEARRAQEAVDQQKEALESSRERELKAISVTVNDVKLTRLEIEEKISALQDEITKKEEETLEPKRRALDLANKEIELEISSISYLGKNQAAWVLVEDQIKLANKELQKYADTLKLLSEGKFNFDGSTPSGSGGAGGARTVPGSATGNTARGNEISYNEVRPGVGQASTSAGASREVNLGAERTISTGEVAYRAMRGESVDDFAARVGVDPSQVRLAGSSDNQNPNYLNNNQLIYVNPEPQNKAMGGIIRKAYGGMIRKAFGGRISGASYRGRGMFSSLGSDTVPAMLTPGEFVVRRPAVRSFGIDNLKSINRGTYNGNSVYNYSVNVNVSTDADPDRIARAVMTEIKRSDSQRIRRF